MNKGLVTELAHYGLLQEVFDQFKVSDPKGFATGSDFTISHPEFGGITFESKSANTDLFDAGVITSCVEGNIQNISGFYNSQHKQELQDLFYTNVPQIKEHCVLANVSQTTYTTSKSVYEEIQAAGKLINIKTSAPAGLISASLTQWSGEYVKANYVIIGDLIYRASPDAEFDPLHLAELDVPALSEKDIKNFEIRSRRGGSRGVDKRVSVTLRASYKFAKQLTPTPLKLDSSLRQIVRAQLRKHY